MHDILHCLPINYMFYVILETRLLSFLRIKYDIPFALVLQAEFQKRHGSWYLSQIVTKQGRFHMTNSY